MNRLILVFILIAKSIFCTGQAYKDDLKSQFLAYYELLGRKDFKKAVEYVNPTFFKLISRDQFIASMEMVFNNPDIHIEVEAPYAMTIGDKKRINDVDYVKFQYSSYMKMRFKVEEGEEMDTVQTLSALKIDFGESNVTYDSIAKFYRIRTDSDVIANTSDTKRWTFIVVEKEKVVYLKKILPKELF
jgi:hypothetical protein